MQIHLIVLSPSGQEMTWELGRSATATADAAALNRVAERLAADDPADYLLFWDAALGAPQPERILDALAVPGDVWHAGLRLGMAGRPRLMDFVDPTWRFNRDPDPDLTAVSWRLSLRSCLARAMVWRRLGGLDGRFLTLNGAALEMGRRWIGRGALMRHVPDLLPVAANGAVEPSPLPLEDELRFVHRRYGRMWAAWAGWRAIRNGAPPGAIWSGLRRVWSEAPSPEPPALQQTIGREDPLQPLSANDRAPKTFWAVAERPTVSVLIPTLDRYPQLFDLLDQLRRQEEKPLEIVVVDQIESERLEQDWPVRYADLPLRVIRRDVAGQCSSRNAGLMALRGETVLFLDDDDRIPDDLIRRHLDFLAFYGVDASCGVAEEVGAGALPPAYRLVRDSDVFPTNNSLLRVEALRASGLFDLAYDRGERADGDLGMRLYLAGKLLALNPAAAVVHLHAPRGGLREHKARVVTRSASRHSLWRRQLLAPTEGYLWVRYFSPRQVNEALLIRTVSSLRGAHGGWRSLARALVMTVLLPDTWRQNQARLALGRELMRTHPTIPDLRPTPVEEVSCL